MCFSTAGGEGETIWPLYPAAAELCLQAPLLIYVPPVLEQHSSYFFSFAIVCVFCMFSVFFFSEPNHSTVSEIAVEKQSLIRKGFRAPRPCHIKHYIYAPCRYLVAAPCRILGHRGINGMANSFRVITRGFWSQTADLIPVPFVCSS